MSPLWDARSLIAALGATGDGFDINGIAFDTRALAPGDLFIALKGERDGHDFVAEAISKGAAGALVSQDMPGPVLRVDDTLHALTRLAVAARARTKARIIAITGSVGKTTTKEMLRRTLSVFGTVHAAESSFNNHIGVPLTLARMSPAADFGVFEIGMNHPGEIQPLATLVQPDVSIITCIDRAHLGLMGSQDAIAVEKASIFAPLRSGGVAVLPADSAYAPQLAAAVPAGARKLVFGVRQTEARLIAAASTPQSCEIHAVIGGVAVRLRLDLEEHHVERAAHALRRRHAMIGQTLGEVAH
ncbi:MAG: UDP-N-acetylmuramoyl-tripeptide--D-alanyl-D-alanine ligase, partial [Acidocella sp.]|nr:UDP-N-acetylmuramoyl-tripeptide--D-alanyl-D-alanine ligase [Acidocella sp.]